MDLKLSGRVVEILDEQSGEGRNGPWRKRDFILETPGDYPSKVCITQWGDDIDKFAVSVDEELVASIDIRSREYQGRWYTDVKAWRVERPQGTGAGPSPDSLDPPMEEFPGVDDEDLPF
ncbi:MAG: DUF3127 domain-containing protein [Candidatus Palauibacterales bacterium]|nr:DUF3127 domain-containing protein [Candidatus Palauibacterales bacterium]